MNARRQIIFLLLFIGCLVLIEVIPSLRRGLWPLEQAAAAVNNFTYSRFASVRNMGSRLFLGSHDAEEIKTLRTMVATLEFDRSRLKKLEEENKALQQLLSLKEHQAWDMLATRIIGSDPIDPVAAVVISAGRQDGVFSGAAVVDPQGLFLCAVGNVS